MEQKRVKLVGDRNVSLILVVVGLIAGWRAMQMAWDQRLRSVASVCTFICGFVLVQPIVLSLTQAIRR